jgi:hypothetical protein
VPWKITDLLAYDLSSESQRKFSASRLGMAHVDFKVADAHDASQSRSARQSWLQQFDGAWLIASVDSGPD